MGERTPHLDASARGGWIGLTAKHTRADLIRALIEGVAYSQKDCLEIIEGLGVRVDSVRASGGGARSPLWRQILADIFDRRVVTLQSQEGSAYGAALLAMTGPASSVRCRKPARPASTKRTRLNHARQRRVFTRAGIDPTQLCTRRCSRSTAGSAMTARVDKAAQKTFEVVFSRSALVVLVALLLGETTINYIDRQVVSVLAPTLRAEFHLSNGQYAAIVNAFLVVYAVSTRQLDGPSINWVWARVNALDSVVVDRRHAYGVGARIVESGIFPWGAGDRRRRVVAGIRQGDREVGSHGGAHAGDRHLQQRSSLGSVIAPPLVVWITLRFGWRRPSWRRVRWAWYGRGVPGFPQVASGDGAVRGAHGGRGEAHSVGRATALPANLGGLHVPFPRRPSVVFLRVLDSGISDSRARLTLKGIGDVAWIPFLVAGIGNVAGGYLTLRLQRAGWSVNRTRKTLMVIATVLSPLGIFAAYAHSLFWTITMISVAVFFWIFWSIAVHSLAGDYFPPRAVASVYGSQGRARQWDRRSALGRRQDSRCDAQLHAGLHRAEPADAVAMVVGFSLMGRVEMVRDFD